MLLALIVCQLSALVSANPFHKYPSVFLLDVGNEELEKTNTEQIRLSMPGGSVALRYPAIGDGYTIGHLRVSSIDFGTALKANIVDGGPGYKYAVIVLMGNPGVPYDAVVTVQTVNDQTFNIPNVGFVSNSDVNAVPVEEDANNSAEDTSEDDLQNDNNQSENYEQSSNAELMQSSDNVYHYAESKVMDQSDNYDTNSNSYNNNDGPNNESDVEEEDNEESESDDNDNESDQRDIHKEYTEDIEQNDDSNVEVKGIGTEDEDDDGEISPELAQSIQNDYAEDNEAVSIIRSRINSNYDGLRPYLSGGEVYYEDADQKDTRPDYQQLPLDYDSPDEIQQIFNDGEVHNDDDKYKDSNNNNYVDSDDNFAVAY